MKNRIGWLAAVLAVVAGVSWLTIRGAAQRKVVPAATAAGESRRQISDQVEALERVTRNLQSRLDRAETRAPSAGPAPTASAIGEQTEASPEPEDALASMSPAERNELVVNSTLELLDEVVAQERPDSSGTTEAIRSLDGLMATSELAGTRATAVDCVATLCRFRMQHDDAEARTQFRPALRHPPFRGNLFFHFDKEKNETMVYAARPGRSLPKADLREAAARLAP
jgi:hypothetical protein